MTTDAQVLTELNTWLPLLAELEQGRGRPRSPAFTPGGKGGNDESRLPFSINVDDPDNLSEARNAATIMLWAMTWATHFESWYGRSIANPLLYLASIAEQAAAGHPDDWQQVMDEARTHHARTAARTGHSPQREDSVRCPSCGASLTREPTDKGLIDALVCASCGETYADDGHAQAVRHHTITTSQAEDVWVTREDVATLWPNLDRRTLHAWVTRGHVTRDTNGRYLLADLTLRTRRLAA